VRTMVLSETRPVGRPDAFSGSAGGLQLGECLGETVGRANYKFETAPAPIVRILESPARGTPPTQRLGGPDASALASSAWLDRRALLSFRAGA
jgi:hypothetical protein